MVALQRHVLSFITSTQLHSRRFDCSLVGLRARSDFSPLRSNFFIVCDHLLASLEVLEEEYGATNNTGGAQKRYISVSAW